MLTKSPYLLVIMSCLVLGILTTRADELPNSEEIKINALISHVESLEKAEFIRNGKSYDAATAAKFLRGKWKANDDKIKTANDFIDHAASYSGTTGKPYLIQLENGEKPNCGDYLKAILKNIDAKK